MILEKLNLANPVLVQLLLQIYVSAYEQWFLKMVKNVEWKLNLKQRKITSHMVDVLKL